MAQHSTSKTSAEVRHLAKVELTGNDLDIPTRDRAGKSFSALRAKFALHGVCLYRTDPADGPVTYWSESEGMFHMLPTIEAVQALLVFAETAS